MVHLLHRLNQRLLSLAVELEISLLLGKLSFLSLQFVILLDNLSASLFEHEVMLLLGLPQSFHFLWDLVGRSLWLIHVDGPNWVELRGLVGRQLLHSMRMRVMVHRVMHAFLHLVRVPRNPLGRLVARLVLGFIQSPWRHLYSGLTFRPNNGRYWYISQHFKGGTHPVDVIQQLASRLLRLWSTSCIYRILLIWTICYLGCHHYVSAFEQHLKRADPHFPVLPGLRCQRHLPLAEHQSEWERVSFLATEIDGLSTIRKVRDHLVDICELKLHIRFIILLALGLILCVAEAAIAHWQHEVSELELVLSEQGEAARLLHQVTLNQRGPILYY